MFLFTTEHCHCLCHSLLYILTCFLFLTSLFVSFYFSWNAFGHSLGCMEGLCYRRQRRTRGVNRSFDERESVFCLACEMTHNTNTLHTQVSRLRQRQRHGLKAIERHMETKRSSSKKRKGYTFTTKKIKRKAD